MAPIRSTFGARAQVRIHRRLSWICDVPDAGRTAASLTDREALSREWCVAIHCYNTTHVEWTGCSLHDMIQPSFSFLVGVALPYSIASRLFQRGGQSPISMTVHAAWRALALVFLGVFLRSVGKPQTYFTFEDTLSQIGLGYLFLFLLGLYGQRIQWLRLLVLVAGYWGAFFWYPEPPANFDYAAVSVPPTGRIIIIPA